MIGEPPKPFNQGGNSPFKPTSNGFGIQPISGGLPSGGMHDTFRVDRDGNINGGHTTVQIPGGQKIRMPWE